MKWISSIVGVCGLYSVALCQQLEADRPDQTEASSTIPKGSFQIESGLGFQNVKIYAGPNPHDLTTENHFTLPTTLFRIALCNRFEWRVVNTLRFSGVRSAGHLERNIGIDDIETGFKWQLTGENVKWMQMAFLSHVVVPTGSDGNRAFGTVNKLLVSHDLSDKISIGYNIGHQYFGSGKGDLIYTIAMGFAITDKLGCYLENFGQFTDLNSFQTNFDAGLTYYVKDNFMLDYSFGAGVRERMNYQSIGVTYRFPY
ncbi:MAG: transporter [Crocinitomicaceae bacterium]